MVKYSILSDFSVSVCMFVAFLHREFRLKNQTNKDSKEEDEKKTYYVYMNLYKILGQ